MSETTLAQNLKATEIHENNKKIKTEKRLLGRLKETQKEKDVMNEILTRDSLGQLYLSLNQYGLFFEQYERIPPYSEEFDRKTTLLWLDKNRRFAYLLGEFHLHSEALLRFKMIYKVVVKTNNPSLFYALSDIANSYYGVRNYDSAEYWYKRAIDLARTNKKYSGHLLSAYNNLGAFYLRVGEFDKSKSIFEEGINEYEDIQFKTRDDSIHAALLYGNLGTAYCDIGDLEIGMEMLLTDINLSAKTKLFGSRVRAINRLVEFAISLDYDYNLNILGLLDTVRQDIPKLKISERAGVLLDMYENYVNYYKMKGDYKSMASIQQDYLRLMKTQKKESQEVQTNIRLAFFRHSVDKLNKTARLELRSKEQRIARLNYQKKYMTSMIVYSIITLVVIIVFVAFVVIQKRKRNKAYIVTLRYKNELERQRAELNMLEKENLERDLNYKSRDLTDLALHFKQTDDLLNRVQKSLKKIQKNRDNQDKVNEGISVVLRTITRNLNMNKTDIVLRSNIDEFNNRFLETLKTKFPGLTNSEIQLCGMLRLRMSNKEIAAIRGSSYESVRVSRYRLRKKLNLSSDENISDFLSQLK